VQNILKETHGNKVRFVTTGVSGENKCRNATIITDHEGSATGGFGAVMGSKNLKAIAVLGAGKPLVARKDELTQLNRHIIHISKRGTLRMPVPKKQMQFVKTASCYQCGLECGRGIKRRLYTQGVSGDRALIWLGAQTADCPAARYQSPDCTLASERDPAGSFAHHSRGLPQGDRQILETRESLGYDDL
jgi:aldehyde:ferredoxin oxidoreductase